MSTEMGLTIPDCETADWSIEVAVTNGRVRISAMGLKDGAVRGGKVFLNQEGVRELMQQLQAAHAYNNWQPYPDLHFDT